MRTVSFDLSSDSIYVAKQFGGYQGEHNATLLSIKLPERMLTEEIAQYRFDFETSTGENILGEAIDASAVSGGVIQTTLFQSVMFAPILSVCVCAYKYDPEDATKPILIEKSSAVDLIIKNPVAGSEDGEAVDPLGPGSGVTIDTALDPTSLNPIANKPVAEKFQTVDNQIQAIPVGEGKAEGTIQNALSTAGCLGFYYTDTSVSGTTFTCTLLDKDGNPAILPVRGDLTGDGMVTDADAIYLSSHFEDPQNYPLNQDCDFNGDEILDLRDDNRLLLFVQFPDSYSLANPLISCKADYSWSCCGRVSSISGATITVELTTTPPSDWVPGDCEYDPTGLEYSGYIWFPFGPQAGTVPIGQGATSVGQNSCANADGALAAGENTTADGVNSSSVGAGTVAKGNAQTVVGQYNKPLGSDYLAVVGAGDDTSHRKNAMAVDKAGNLYLRGNVYAGNTDSSGVVGGTKIPIGVQINGTDVTPESDGKVNLEMGVWKRLRLGDFGNSWRASTDSGNQIFHVPLPTELYNVLVTGQARCVICRDYGYHAYAPTNKTFVIGNYLSKGLHIRDDSYSDVTSFLAARGDTYMYYIP